MTKLIISVYALSRNNHRKLYLPSTSQTSDIELLTQKLKLYIHRTNTAKRDNIYKFRFYMPGEHNCLILTS